jgi:hypothetical protein
MGTQSQNRICQLLHPARASSQGHPSPPRLKDSIQYSSRNTGNMGPVSPQPCFLPGYCSCDADPPCPTWPNASLTHPHAEQYSYSILLSVGLLSGSLVGITTNRASISFAVPGVTLTQTPAISERFLCFIFFKSCAVFDPSLSGLSITPFKPLCVCSAWQLSPAIHMSGVILIVCHFPDSHQYFRRL